MAHLIINHWVVYHGVLRQILSDQEPEFEGQMFKKLVKLLELKKIHTSPYRPQTDGKVELFNER